jgi:hypothetical protein
MLMRVVVAERSLMKMLSLMLGTLLAILSMSQAYAEPSEVGVWRLTSIVFVDEATGAKSDRFGAKPDGYAIFTPGGYMSVVINAEGRMPLSGDASKRVEEQARLFSTMTAHAGKYRMENGHLVHPVDVAHDPTMVGRDLLRTTRFISPDIMESTTPTATMPDGRKGYSIIIWRRVN